MNDVHNQPPFCHLCVFFEGLTFVLLETFSETLQTDILVSSFVSDKKILFCEQHVIASVTSSQRSEVRGQSKQTADGAGPLQLMEGVRLVFTFC